jgi:hypothetical protein
MDCVPEEIFFEPDVGLLLLLDPEFYVVTMAILKY